jgi:hypothetical protein
MADSVVGMTLTQGHQRAQTTVERLNDGVNSLWRAITRTPRVTGEIRAWEGFSPRV